MTKYVRITSSTRAVIEEKDESKFRGGKPPPANMAKDWEWLPLVIVRPEHNPSIEKQEGPTDVITATEVTRTWTVRSLTSAELDEGKDLRIPSSESISYKVMLDQENRVRTLEALPVYTDAEFRAVLRSRM